MSKRHQFRAAAAFASLTFVLFAADSAFDTADVKAAAATAPAPAPARGAIMPNAVISNPTAAAPARGAVAPSAVISNPPAGPAAAAPAAALAPAAPAAAGAPGAPPAIMPRILVIDRNYILQRSSAGQDMLAQAQNLSRQAETQFKTEETALVTEAGQLQQQLAIMAPDVRDTKEKEFNAKQQAFQTRVANRQAEIQAGFNKAARQLEVALEPILKAIMTERGANMVVERSTVILSTIDIDVTPVAVQRLDRALPKVRVELTPVPAGAAVAAGRGPGVPALATPASAPGRR